MNRRHDLASSLDQTWRKMRNLAQELIRQELVDCQTKLKDCTDPSRKDTRSELVRRTAQLTALLPQTEPKQIGMPITSRHQVKAWVCRPYALRSDEEQTQFWDRRFCRDTFATWLWDFRLSIDLRAAAKMEKYNSIYATRFSRVAQSIYEHSAGMKTLGRIVNTHLSDTVVRSTVRLKDQKPVPYTAFQDMERTIFGAEDLGDHGDVPVFVKKPSRMKCRNSLDFTSPDFTRRFSQQRIAAITFSGVS